MIQKSKNKWFEDWGNEVAQNQILKYLLLVFAFANSILAISLVCISLKTPVLTSQQANPELILILQY